MINPESIGVDAFFDRADHLRENFTAIVFLAKNGTGADRVVDRCHACGGHLGVVREGGGEAIWPEHAGPRNEMFFHIVGMHLDDTGCDVITLNIDRGRQVREACVDGDDAVMVECECASHDFVFKHELGICEDCSGHAAAL